MTESIDPTLQILPTPKKRASYRPAALRTNSHSRHHPQHSSLSSGSPSSPAIDARGLSRTSTGNSSSYGSSHSQVTRRHWTPDAESPSCSACPTQFSLFERKHHCRRCGLIFCSQHSNYSISLSPTAEFSVTGVDCKSCLRCRRDFELWMNPAPPRPSTGSFQRTSNNTMVRPQAVRGRSNQTTSSGANEEDDEMRGGPAASVPSDWTWSTF